VPVLAYAAGAVPETLGGAGVLVTEKRIGDIAAVAEQMITDEIMRKKLKKLETERIKRYKRESDPARLLALLKDL
jgi:glycosyltransferase involved in cell wall biosynthesis